MTLSIEEQIKGLADAISSAQLNFDVWRALELSRQDPENVRVLNHHLEFFLATIPANFESCLVSCYQFLETKDDRISFPSLIKELLVQESMDVRAIPKLQNLEAAMKPTWLRISALRNNHIGHLSKHNTPAAVYAKAGLNDALMEAFINQAKELHRGITHMRDQSVDAFNIRGKESVEKLLSTLRRQL